MQRFPDFYIFCVFLLSLSPGRIRFKLLAKKERRCLIFIRQRLLFSSRDQATDAATIALLHVR